LVNMNVDPFDELKIRHFWTAIYGRTYPYTTLSLKFINSFYYRKELG
jgi:hypothetical protein